LLRWDNGGLATEQFIYDVPPELAEEARDKAYASVEE
jgi:hypothetical protein